MTVLGVLRSLSSQSITAHCVLPTTDFVAHSTHYRPLPRHLGQLEDLSELASFLDGLPIARAVLIPCSDHAVRAVAQLDVSFKERFATSLPPLASVELFHDKGAFAILLDKLHVPHPTTVIISSAETLKQLTDDQFVDGFLKPRDSQAFARHFKRKAFRVNNREDALARWSDIDAAGLSVVLQKYIPGPSDRHYFIDGFIDRGGNIRAKFARRRLRIYPPDFGDSSYMVSLPLEKLAQASDSLDKIFAAVPYRGVFSAEFKWDERDNLYKILEVNTRPWWYNEFAAWCGVDTTQMAYRDALEMDISTITEYVVDRRMAFFLNDFPACRKLHREHQLSAGAWAKSWWSARPAVFRLDDPLPSLCQIGTVLINKLAQMPIVGKNV